MTIINPNSISGITSFTAEADVMNFYRSNGTLGSLQLNGCNFHTPTGISTFNNLNVGGTLTYEDVKNVDSVGIISARTAIHVGAGISAVGIITGTSFRGDGSQLTGITIPGGNTGLDFNDNVKARFGTGNDLEIYFQGADSYFRNDNGGNIVIVNSTTGTIELDPGGGKVQIKNDLEIADSIIHTGDTNTKIRFPAADTITAETGGSERLRINSSGQISIGNNPTVASDAALHIELDGTREYLRLEGDGGTSNAYIELEAPNNRRKAIIFKSGGTRRGVIGIGDSDEAADATSLFFSASSNIAGNSPHMSIASSGNVTIAGLLEVTASGDCIKLAANRRLVLGQSWIYGSIYNTGSNLTFNALNQYTFACWDGNSMENWMTVSGVNGRVSIGGGTMGNNGTKQPLINVTGHTTQSITMSSSDGSNLTERFKLTDSGITMASTVGIQTNDVTRANLANPVGAGNSLVGMYIGDGSLLFNNTLNRVGGYYISTETNALNAGPVTLDANMKVDGAWVIV